MVNGNRFHKAESVDQLLRQLVGAASMCWENPGGAGIFDTALALKVSEEAYERLGELLSINIGGRHEKPRATCCNYQHPDRPAVHQIMGFWWCDECYRDASENDKPLPIRWD